MATKAELEKELAELKASQITGIVIEAPQSNGFFTGQAIRGTFNNGDVKGEVEVKLLHSEKV